MSKTASDVGALFKDAHKEGDLSMQSMQVLTGNLDIGAQIQAGLGVAAEDVAASEVVLVTQMPDDSGSIRFAGNADLVRKGHNEVIDALMATKQKDGILAHTRYLNGNVLFPYRKLEDVVRMDSKNYDPNQMTPLYDQSLVLLGTVLAKWKEFQDVGVPCRTITLLISDGADTSSRGGPHEVRALVKDMLRKEVHIIAAMGIEDPDAPTDFNTVFKDMGIKEDFILTPKNNPSEIRKAFQVFSQSAVRASQNAASFSKTALGGFGN